MVFSHITVVLLLHPTLISASGCKLKTVCRRLVNRRTPTRASGVEGRGYLDESILSQGIVQGLT